IASRSSVATAGASSSPTSSTSVSPPPARPRSTTSSTAGEAASAAALLPSAATATSSSRNASMAAGRISVAARAGQTRRARELPPAARRAQRSREPSPSLAERRAGPLDHALDDGEQPAPRRPPIADDDRLVDVRATGQHLDIEQHARRDA